MCCLRMHADCAFDQAWQDYYAELQQATANATNDKDRATQIWRCILRHEPDMLEAIAKDAQWPKEEVAEQLSQLHIEMRGLARQYQSSLPWVRAAGSTSQHMAHGSCLTVCSCHSTGTCRQGSYWLACMCMGGSSMNPLCMADPQAHLQQLSLALLWCICTLQME